MPPPGSGDEARLVVAGAEVFDGTAWLGRTSIRVNGGRISEVGRALTPERGETVLAADGMFVVPGLVDSHIHLFPGFLPRLPAFGVTSVVDMFTTTALLARLRREERSSGPRAGFVTAGVGASAPGGHPHQLARQGLYDPFPSISDSSEAEAFVVDRIREGSRFLKIFVEDGSLAGTALPCLTPPAIRRLCDAAHEHGIQVIAHALTAAAASTALLCGADGLAHAVVPGSCPDDRKRLLDQIKSRDVFVVSTLTAIRSVFGRTHASLVGGTRLAAAVGAGWRGHLRRTAGPVDDIGWGRTCEFMHDLVRHDVPIAAGTDAAFPGVVPGLSLHAELQLLVACGMRPLDAIASATRVPGDAFGLGSGRIRAGARSDLVVLEADPRSDIGNTQRIAATIVGGRAVAA